MNQSGGGQGATATEWKKVRLLVFGLDDQFRFLARQTFRKLAIREVVSFSVPADTPGLMKRGADVVLVDLGEKPDDGLAVIERLRRPAGNPYDDVPVLVVAFSRQTDMVNRARALGVEGVVAKPATGQELERRVAQVLASPRRMAPPAAPPSPPPKQNFIKDVPPSPPPVPAPPTPAPAVPAVAVNSPRPDREGPWTTLTGGGPVAAMEPARSRPLPPAEPAVPPPSRPSGGRLETGGPVTAPRRPAGGRLDAGDIVSASGGKGGGKLDAADLVAPVVAKASVRGIETAPPANPAPPAPPAPPARPAVPAQPKPAPGPVVDAEAERKRAEKRKALWKEALAKSGHEKRTGGDVASLDVGAMVAEHGQWLQSKGAEGKRASFAGLDLAGADLTGAILANATFREADLSDACLSEARLDGSDFRYAKLSAADLGGANLGVAALRHARLNLSNLEGAVLRGSDLSGATLSGARMAGADLKGAIMIGADLRQADLSKVEGLVQGQIEKSLCDMSTRLPPGVFRPGQSGED